MNYVVMGDHIKWRFIMKKILAVDDQAEVINIIADLLAGKYEVYPAKTTAKAFSLLHATKFDLILLDILMPGMNGIEFLEYIKKQVWYENTPVIFVSSESDFNTVAQAVHLGADGYIKKPIEKEILLTKIQAVIGG
jgi:two-component system phosphate regulon response regulator PhoB